MHGIPGTVTDRTYVERLEAGVTPEKAKCRYASCAVPPAPGPSHDGSPGCQSGALAAPGGYRSHCTCDTCY